MIYEKPWNKEFTRLLAALEIALGGKIVEPEIDESYSRGYSSEVAYYNYSLLHAEIDNVGVRVEISHNEMAGAVLLDGSDQTAFLVLCALSHPQGFFRIRPEGVDVRLLKFIRIENEFDTSNPDFNDALFLEVSDNKAKRLLQRADLQEMILALLPFDSLQAHSKGLRYSELLTQKKQLDCEYVISTLKQLVALAQVIESPV